MTRRTAHDATEAARRTAPWWTMPDAALFARLGSSAAGLGADEAARRLAADGPNRLQPTRRDALAFAMLRRLGSPLVLILLVAASLSIVLHEWFDATVVLAILLVTVLLSTLQERRAGRAVDALRGRVALQCTVLRDGRAQRVAAETLVAGDVIELSAGALVPADCRVLEARDCFVRQAALTGESLPVEKAPGTCAADAPLAARDNCVFMGTSLRSGWARALVVATARDSAFGAVAARLARTPPPTEFERGLRRFGAMLVALMLLVVVAVLAINLALQRPVFDTVLFAAALAVGLSPELLPAILTVTLARGARLLAERGVIVKRLDAIENLGSMDLLCTDKTGTLTRGVLDLEAALDPDGSPSRAVLELAVTNATLQTGLENPLDAAIVERGLRDAITIDPSIRLDEVPYDFMHRRLGIVVRGGDGQPRMISKGAVDNVLEVCSEVRDGDRTVVLDNARREMLAQRFAAWSADGLRVLAVAVRTLPPAPRYTRADESGMTLVGFLRFLDPPEPQAAATLARLADLGVAVKVVTGDNRYVARHVAGAVGMPVEGLLTGGELQRLDDEALRERARATTVFAEIDPTQKERIVHALRRSGHVVGFLGDGINDAPALQAADVGVSVDGAVDVAREAADFVLLEHDLDVLVAGIDGGRRTFANTLKYVFVTTSANFGNMLSMAAASMVLPFLPLLAKQILLNNLLSDIPALGLAGDRVDPEWERTPHRWDIRLVMRSMLVFGLISTAFDLLTFGALYALAAGAEALFRTGWFVESLLTEIAVLFVIRTWRPLHRSRPGRALVTGAAIVAPIALLLPWLPGAGVFGFVPLPPIVLAAVLMITILYVLASEAAKRRFYRHLAGFPARA